MGVCFYSRFEWIYLRIVSLRNLFQIPFSLFSLSLFVAFSLSPSPYLPSCQSHCATPFQNAYHTNIRYVNEPKTLFSYLTPLSCSWPSFTMFWISSLRHSCRIPLRAIPVSGESHPELSQLNPDLSQLNPDLSQLNLNLSYPCQVSHTRNCHNLTRTCHNLTRTCHLTLSAADQLYVTDDKGIIVFDKCFVRISYWHG